jgi:hypothetical protein
VLLSCCFDVINREAPDFLQFLFRLKLGSAKFHIPRRIYG